VRHLGLDFPNTKPCLMELAASVRARDEEVLRSLIAGGGDLWIPNSPRSVCKAKGELAKKAATEEAERKRQQEEARQQTLSERPELELPAPKDYKEALTRLQTCTSEDFQKKHELEGLSGNKLAKIKYGKFRKIFADFVDTATLQELHKFKGT